MILSQQIPLGARLRDEELAEQLGVSRTPVREALRDLIRDGLVEAVPRSQTRVRMLTESDIEEIFDLRISLEALAVRLAAGRIPEVALKRLRDLYTRAEAALAKGDVRPSLDFDRDMHLTVLQFSGNRRLQEIMATINDYVTLFRNIGAMIPAHRGFNYRHREILRALEREDGESAARFMSEHILVAKEQTQRDFQQHVVPLLKDAE
jgi:DNA-binding GntR family transcriptional regulator